MEVEHRLSERILARFAGANLGKWAVRGVVERYDRALVLCEEWDDWLDGDAADDEDGDE